MDIQMIIVLTLLYVGFVAIANSKRPNATQENLVDYINYFPDIEEEEEELIKDSSSSIPVEVGSATKFDHYASEGMVELMSVTATDVRHLATQAAVIDDPWETEIEFNKAQLEICYQLPTEPLALPPAKETVTETYNCAEFQVIYDYYAEMTIRQLKAECKRLGVKKYSYLKKAELIQLLSQQYI